MRIRMTTDYTEERAKLLGSQLLFTQTFFKLRTGRDFMISQPDSNESHFITISKAFTKVLRGEITHLLINTPPGYGKSELCKHLIARIIAEFPFSANMYVSYGHELASKHTHGIKQIIELPHFKKLFGIELAKDSTAKDYFRTTHGGAVAAFGSKGGITGYDAGLPDIDKRLTGVLLMDDMHKPDEVHSDTTRESVIRNYFETILPRRRGPRVPIIFIGQRLHEDDLPARLLNGEDGNIWHEVIIKALDQTGNSIYPEVNSREMLANMKRTSPYVFASQYMQDPIPAGGGLFKPEWFVVKDEEPKVLATFITADTAETDKTYNDATVFSFWGIYKIEEGDYSTDLYGLHWIDCLETRVEPKDLESEFLDFYAGCMRYAIKPNQIFIEKKSTGGTLLSLLKERQGLNVIDINRSGTGNSKTKRFLEAQPYVAKRLISLPAYGKHTKMCITHMSKITANESHRWDDIADTLYDAVKVSLIDKIILTQITSKDDSSKARAIMSHFNTMQNLRSKRNGVRQTI